MSNRSDSPGLSRTRWAELHVESFVAPAFIAEFVFRSPQVLDRGREREVADLLIVRDAQTLLISQKCQEDPNARRPEKMATWAQKQAVSAASQLNGALRRVGRREEIWCDHPRRGRVHFPDGLPAIAHAIATVEVFDRTELPADLPVENQRTPVTYLSVSDFLNLVQQLRTVPEMIRYLDKRRTLPESELRTIGGEQVLFGYYLLSDGTFDGFTSFGDVEKMLIARAGELQEALDLKAQRDRYGFLLEDVADQLAGRHPNYRRGLSSAVLDYYEPDGERRGYLQMQDLIAGMHLAERAALGSVFEGAIAKRNGDTGLTVAAALIGSQPDTVFVFGSFGETPTSTRNALLSSFHALANDAMAHYGRSRCFIVFDRDGASYEVALAQLTSPLPPDLQGHESKVFGPLRTFTHDLHFRPS